MTLCPGSSCDPGGEHSCTVGSSDSAQLCNTHILTQRPFSHTPHPADSWNAMCHTGQGILNPKGCLVQRQFHFSTFRRGKFLSLPGARHFRDIETQHSLNNMVWITTAMLAMLMERAELKGGWRATPGSQPPVQSLPGQGSTWEHNAGAACQYFILGTGFLGLCLGTGFIFGTLKIYQTNRMLQTTLRVQRISTAAVPANTERALDKGSGCCCCSVKYNVFLKPR